MHPVVWSQRASSEKSLFGERGESASPGTILKGKNTLKALPLSLSVTYIFSILTTSIPLQMVNGTIFVIVMETDFIQY